MTVHFLDLADGRVVAYTTVRAKDGWEQEGRILVGQLEGLTIQAGVRVFYEGFTEVLDRLVCEVGRYYFDEPFFESEQLF